MFAAYTNLYDSSTVHSGYTLPNHMVNATGWYTPSQFAIDADIHPSTLTWRNLLDFHIQQITREAQAAQPSWSSRSLLAASDQGIATSLIFPSAQPKDASAFALALKVPSIFAPSLPAPSSPPPASTASRLGPSPLLPLVSASAALPAAKPALLPAKPTRPSWGSSIDPSPTKTRTRRATRPKAPKAVPTPSPSSSSQVSEMLAPLSSLEYVSYPDTFPPGFLTQKLNKKGGLARPMNSWVLYRKYRSYLLRESGVKIESGLFSQMVSLVYKAMPKSEQDKWNQLGVDVFDKFKRANPHHAWKEAKGAGKKGTQKTGVKRKHTQAVEGDEEVELAAEEDDDEDDEEDDEEEEDEEEENAKELQTRRVRANNGDLLHSLLHLLQLREACLDLKTITEKEELLESVTGMEASLQAFSLKSFIKVLQCLAKFGDDLHLHASSSDLRMSVVNQTKSAFCLVTLDPEFFVKYRLVGKKTNKGYGDARQKDIKCQLLVKSLLAVLSKQASSQNVTMLEMQIVEGEETPARRYDRDEEEHDELASIESRLIVKLICKHGVIKTHTLLVGSSPFSIVIVDPNTTPSQYVVPSRLLREWLDHFAVQASSNTEYELGWHLGREEVKVKTFAMGGGIGGLQTLIGVGVDDFEEYFVDDTELRVGETEVGHGLKMSIPMKEFRAALTLSESFQVSLAARFSEATQPLVLNLEIEGCRAEIVIATTLCQAFNVVDEPRKSKPKSYPPAPAPAPAKTPSAVKRKTPPQNGTAASQSGRRLKFSSQAVIPESQLGLGREPLFMPGGSQREYDEEAMERRSQSQKMALQAVGLDGIDELELLGMMDDDDPMDDGMDESHSVRDDFAMDDPHPAAEVRDAPRIPSPPPRLSPEESVEPPARVEAEISPRRERSETVLDDVPVAQEAEEEQILDDDDEPLPATARPRKNMFLIYQD